MKFFVKNLLKTVVSKFTPYLLDISNITFQYKIEVFLQLFDEFFSQAELRTLIGYMGGLCIDQLVESGTHLVTESVRTKKYEVFSYSFALIDMH